VEMRDAHVEGENGAVMRWVGVHIEAKQGRGRLRDGGASKENICFFPGEGFKGSESSKCLYSGRVLGS
jgi:hypothetical protein